MDIAFTPNTAYIAVNAHIVGTYFILKNLRCERMEKNINMARVLNIG